MGRTRPEDTLPAPVLERVLSALLPVQGAAEMGVQVARVLAAASGAPWVAVFRREGETLTPCGCSGGAPGLLGDAAFLARAAAAPDAAAMELGAARAILAGGRAEERVVLLGGPAAELGHEALRALADHCATALRNADLHDALQAQVITDPLTGCYNRRGLDDHLRVEMVRARRYRRPLSLVLLDVDHFKRVNDELGHAAGDDVLRAVARLLLDAFRTTDRVCRYGGDEFAVVFPETPRDRVVELAERLRARIATRFPDDDVPLPVTASFGVAGYPGDADDPEELLRAADRALYAAKAQGRDRVLPA